MKKIKINYFLIIAALLPLLLFKFPLWTIDLDAPQFPEGLQIRIFISEITGDEEHSLESINILNHYIGMKEINPEDIPELKYMSGIAIFMMAAGLIIAFTDKKNLILVWVIVFSLLGILGLYDFYTWNVDYGSNLDPSAMIKMSGMTYTPPVFGTKQILNFVVTSLPGIGGYALFSSIALGWVIVIVDFLKNRKK